MRTRALLLSIMVASTACANSTSEASESAGTSAPPVTSDTSPSTIPATSTTTTSRTPTTMAEAGESSMVADFSDPSSVNAWFVQNDTVMGGVSSSSVEFDAGTMVFSGVLSTDNNGGFTSARGPVLSAAPTAGWTSMSIEAEGDGRTYLVQVRTDTDGYIQRFTPAETMAESILKLSDFGATDWRLAPIANRPPLTSESIRQVSIYLVDKQEGEFVLRLRSVTLSG